MCRYSTCKAWAHDAVTHLRTWGWAFPSLQRCPATHRTQLQTWHPRSPPPAASAWPRPSPKWSMDPRRSSYCRSMPWEWSKDHIVHKKKQGISSIQSECLNAFQLNPLTLCLMTALLVETRSHWRGKPSPRTNLRDKGQNFTSYCATILNIFNHIAFYFL